jgi:hypothetical protein
MQMKDPHAEGLFVSHALQAKVCFTAESRSAKNAKRSNENPGAMCDRNQPANEWRAGMLRTNTLKRVSTRFPQQPPNSFGGKLRGQHTAEG